MTAKIFDRKSTALPRGDFTVTGDIREVHVLGEWSEDRGQTLVNGVIVIGEDLVVTPHD